MMLLLLNAFKGMKKKKIQMLAIISIITISSAIYMSMNTAITRVENGYYSYLNKENVEHFSFTPKVDAKKITPNELQLLNTIAMNGEETQIVNVFKMCYTTNCNDEIYKYIEFIFTKYGKNIYLNSEEIDKVALKHKFKYELETSKVLKDKKNYIKVVPYSDKKINKIYLVEGEFPKKDGEISILPGFAETNNIKIGNSIKILEKTYKVTGFSYLSDHIYPLISFNVPIFNEETNNIVVMTNNDYKEINENEQLVYAARFDKNMSFKGRMQMSFSAGENDKKNDGPIMKVAKEEAIDISFMNFARFLRTDTIQNDLEPNRIFTEAFLYLLLGVAAFIIMVIVKKRIEDEKKQIGILKSLGYNSFSISSSYLIYSFVGVIIGSTIGYFIGLALSNPLTDVYLSFYNLPLEKIQPVVADIVKIAIIPLILLSFVSFLTAFITVKKKPLYLLKEGSNLKVNIFSKMVNKLLTPFKFETRFKYSLAFRSLGKLLVVSLVAFTSGLLITLVLIGSNLFSNLLDQAFSQMNYKYVIMYNSFRNDIDYESDLIFNIEQKIVKINEKELKEELDINLTGVDNTLKYIKVVDSNEKNLIKKLSLENNVIVPKRIAEVNKIKINDKIFITVNSVSQELKVVGISEDYFSNNIYINRQQLSNLYNFEKQVYNQKFTDSRSYSNEGEITPDEKASISNIFSVDDLKKNINDQVSTFNNIIYFVIAFASVMALIIVLVIANIVVEENKKNISLMKVLGYKNKQISNIILKIYTPFIILAYLISVPTMVIILKTIIKNITKNIDIYIPIEASLEHVSLGLVGLLIAYSIGVNVSRRVLNKISLAIALKRE